MAKIKAGILSKVSGKVAGVVGSTWKGQNYLRELVKPANPNTPLQREQRGKMASVVACARHFTGDVFRPYLDKFLKRMSGYNWFVRENIAKFSGENHSLVSALTWTFGTLQSGTATFGLRASDCFVGQGEEVPSLPSGHRGVAVAIAYNATTDTAAVAVEDMQAEGPGIRAEDHMPLHVGDKMALGLFYVDMDANGVVQQISTAHSRFGALT